MRLCCSYYSKKPYNYYFKFQQIDATKQVYAEFKFTITL